MENTACFLLSVLVTVPFSLANLASNPAEEIRLFGNFVEQFEKDYDTQEEVIHRFKIFSENLKKIEQLSLGQKGTATFGINQYSDLNAEEFRTRRKGYIQRPNRKDRKFRDRNYDIPDVELPEAFDWRDHNAVTEVKNQGNCGSCYAFSATGNIEGQYAIKHKQLLSFSEQEIVDCDKRDDGCDGGDMVQTFEAIKNDLRGLEEEQDYPYKGQKTKCHLQSKKFEVQVIDKVLLSTNETDIAKWLYVNGPVSVGINADSMQFYEGGIDEPDENSCDPNELDHGVLLVGFGTETKNDGSKLPFWIVKNSWGSDFGEDGYYRIVRGSGACGINQDPSSSRVA